MKQSTTSSSVRCSLLPPQLYFIRKTTACLHSFIPICADSIAVGMVIVMSSEKAKYIENMMRKMKAMPKPDGLPDYANAARL